MKQNSAKIGRVSGQPISDGRLDEPAPSQGVLHLSTIGDNFDANRDIALGPHCFLGREDAMQGWEDYPYVDPFPNDESSVLAQRNVTALIYRLLPGIVEKLNAFHGISHSDEFWRLLIFPWMTELTQRAWLSYSALLELTEQFRDRPLTVHILQDSPEYRFEDTGDFFNSLLNDNDFNWWIDSEIVSALAPDGWVLRRSKPASSGLQAADKHSVGTSAGGSVSLIRRGLRSIKYRLGYSDIVGIRWSGFLLSVYANLLPKSPARMQPELQLEISQETYFPEPFLKILEKLIDVTMPESMLDGFEVLETKARKIAYRPGRLRLGALDFWNDQEKIIAAFAKEAREKLVVCQHGGMYGVFKYNPLVHEIEFKSNIFFGWGWTLDEDSGGHILPLPAPYLSKLSNRHKRRNDSVIVIGNPIRLRLSRIVAGARGAGWLRYCEHTIDFLKNISDEIRDTVIFRPYVKTVSDVDIGEVVSQAFPEMPMLKGDLHGAMMDCRLVIIGNCGTTVNIALAANVPTVIYFHDDFLNPRREAAPYFDALKKCGILFSDAEEAASHVNKIWDDVEGWWNSPDVQNARLAWAHQYARTDRFWWWQWMKALARLKDVG